MIYLNLCGMPTKGSTPCILVAIITHATHARLFTSARLLALGLLAALLTLSACTVTGTGGTVDNTPTARWRRWLTRPRRLPPPTRPAGNPVVVYFSKHPDSDSNVNAVFSVNRVSPDLGVAKFSLQQLIAGPTAAEVGAGFYTDLTTSLTGASTCGGADFQLYPDHKGTTVSAPGTMTIKFCRATQLAGDLTGFTHRRRN